MFELELEVRDYECDMQGIVNNSVYLNYLEHTRHKFLQNIGLDFTHITQSGIHLVVAKTRIDYKKPLTSSDVFTSILEAKSASKVKVEFLQQIIKNNTICINATITVVATKNNKIIKIPENILKEFQ